MCDKPYVLWRPYGFQILGPQSKFVFVLWGLTYIVSLQFSVFLSVICGVVMAVFFWLPGIVNTLWSGTLWSEPRWVLGFGLLGGPAPECACDNGESKIKGVWFTIVLSESYSKKWGCTKFSKAGQNSNMSVLISTTFNKSFFHFFLSWEVWWDLYCHFESVNPR